MTDEPPDDWSDIPVPSSLTKEEKEAWDTDSDPPELREQPAEPDPAEGGEVRNLLLGNIAMPESPSADPDRDPNPDSRQAPAQTPCGEAAPLPTREAVLAPALDAPQSAGPMVYRLVRLGPNGIEAVERRGYGSLPTAARAAAERSDECAVSRVELEVSDLLSVDGKLVNEAARALDYDARKPAPKPEWQFLYRPRGDDRTVGTLVDETVPASWLGQAHVGSDGTGVVWTSAGIADVHDHQYTRNTVPEGVFFWSIAATEAWKKRVRPENRGNRPELLPVSAADAERWHLPAGTRLLLLQPAPPGATDEVRNAIPVQEGAIDALMHVDPFGDASTRESWYRIVKLGANGWEPLSKCAHSTQAGAAEEAIRNDYWDADVIMVRANGLEPDVTVIDGKPVGQGPLRTVPDRVEVVACDPETAGQAALDENGTGYVFDGERLIRIENAKVAPGQGAPDGLPAWIYAVLRTAGINPTQRNVQGVIVRIGTETRQQHQLDDEVRAALLSRRTTRCHELYVRTLTLAELRALEGSDSVHLSVGRTGSDEQLPYKLLPGEQDDRRNAGS